MFILEQKKNEQKDKTNRQDNLTHTAESRLSANKKPNKKARPAKGLSLSSEISNHEHCSSTEVNWLRDNQEV